MQRDTFLSRIESLKQRISEAQRSAAAPENAETLSEIENAVRGITTLQEHILEQNNDLAQARRLAEEGKQRYQNLFEFAPDPYLVTSRRGIVRDANHSATQLFRAEKDRVVGRHLSRYMMAEDVARILSDAAIFDSSRRQDFEARLCRPVGAAADVLISVSVNGGEDSLLWLVRDFSAHKDTEEKLLINERLATVGATALLLVQEMSNPLNDMFTTIQGLERELRAGGNGSARLRSTVQELVQETGRLRGLMQRFRSFSRPDRSRPQSIELSAMIADLLAVEADAARAAQISVKQLFLEKRLEILGDYERLREAFANVIRNAIEAMPHGGRLTVRGCSRETGVVVEVMDTGTGIPKGIDIFNLFTTTKFQALGMGLPIARQVVTDHGGTVHYASLRGRTVFRIVLPAPEAGNDSV